MLSEVGGFAVDDLPITFGIVVFERIDYVLSGVESCNSAHD